MSDSATHASKLMHAGVTEDECWGSETACGTEASITTRIHDTLERVHWNACAQHSRTSTPCKQDAACWLQLSRALVTASHVHLG